MKRAAGTISTVLVLLLSVVSCGSPEGQVPAGAASPDAAATAQDGKQLAIRYGCNVCHEMPGVDGGRIGPSLVGLASRPTMSYGTVPTTFESVVQFIENPASLNPATRMPPMGLPPGDARAIAVYLMKER